MIDLTIIIVNFKTDKLVKDCVESIKKSRPQLKYEVIVIDNSKDNRGFAKANNIGIEKAKGRYILFINSDNVVKNRALDKLVDFAGNHTDACVIFTSILYSYVT